MLPPESVMGKPEAFLSDQRVIGVGMELRCPHCQGELKLVSGQQERLHQSRLECKKGHLVSVNVISVPGRSVLYLATTREPETNVN
jgi:hypothetical protein